MEPAERGSAAGMIGDAIDSRTNTAPRR